MWREEYLQNTGERRWGVRYTPEDALGATYHKDSFERVIYFKTREAARRRALELNETIIVLEPFLARKTPKLP